MLVYVPVEVMEAEFNEKLILGIVYYSKCARVDDASNPSTMVLVIATVATSDGADDADRF